MGAFFSGPSQMPALAGQNGRPLVTGDTAPNFQLLNVDGSEVNMVEYTKTNNNPYAIVCFYRGGWCPFCNKQIKAFQNKAAEIDKAGGTLFFLSPTEATADAKKTAADPEQRLPFPLLQDKQNLVAKKFRIVHKADTMTKTMHSISKHNSYVDPATGEKKQGDAEIPLPCAYIIRLSDMQIMWKFGTQEAGVMTRTNPDAVLQQLAALKSGVLAQPTSSSSSEQKNDNSKVPLSDSAKVVIFSIEGCSYCAKAKALLEPKAAEAGASYKVYLLDGDQAVANSDAVEAAIVQLHDHETMPAVFIGGEFVGGFSEVVTKDNSGELAKMLCQ